VRKQHAGKMQALPDDFRMLSVSAGVILLQNNMIFDLRTENASMEPQDFLKKETGKYFFHSYRQPWDLVKFM